MQSRAAWLLVLATLAVAAIGMWLPPGPRAGAFKLAALQTAYFTSPPLILLGYAALATAMKHRSIGRSGWQWCGPWRPRLKFGPGFRPPRPTRCLQAPIKVSHPNRSSPWRRADLVQLARDVMLERGLEPAFPAEALRELQGINAPAPDDDPAIVDMRALPWCSLDNDDSLDLDQLTACAMLPDGRVKLQVAVADVDALVACGSAIDAHAWTNTTSVYTSAVIFPMLPERLSTDLTSLNAGQDRLAIVTEMTVAPDASIEHVRVSRAWVRNKAKLAYDATSDWIDGRGPLPEAARAVAGMDEQLRQQDAVAQRMRARRRAQGSLEFETFQPRAVFEGEEVVDIREQPQNRGRQLIEELMIATNTCVARFLDHAGGASLRRVVRSPERWMRIVEVAHRYGEALPDKPDSQALEGFLARRHRADPLRFPDLSLTIVKLMGAGEYVVESPGASPLGHFGLALRDYTHSTAPNRRYPDLITLRMVKAELAGRPPPYSLSDLAALASHCTQQEDAARKVERRMRKSEAALHLASRIGQVFDAIVTGQSKNDSWVRTFQPPVEGLLVGHHARLDVGVTCRVKLVTADVEHGFIDFVLAS